MMAVPPARPRIPLPAAVRIDLLVVDKSDRNMLAFMGGELVAMYVVAIGSGGQGAKRWEGDRRTPEGEYTLNERHHSEQNHRFLHVSYPNGQDRERYSALARAGQLPSDSSGRPVGIGGAIGVHGFGGRWPMRWFGPTIGATAGCIRVSDEEAEELYRAVLPGASIIIRP